MRLAQEMQQEQGGGATLQEKQLAVVVEDSPSTTPVRPPLQRLLIAFTLLTIDYSV